MSAGERRIRVRVRVSMVAGSDVVELGAARSVVALLALFADLGDA